MFVNVGNDVGNGTYIFTGRFGAPCPRVEMLQQGWFISSFTRKACAIS